MKKRGKLNRILSFVLSLSMVSGDVLPALAVDDPAAEPEVSIVSVDEADEVQVEETDTVAFADDQPDVDEEDEEFVFVPGYVPMPGREKVSVVSDGISFRQIENSIVDNDDYVYTDDLAAKTDSAFPYPYTQTDSIRSYLLGKYPATRNQNPYGSCWAHSAISLAEFYMINHNMADKDVDYSEMHLVYFDYTQGTPSIAGDTGDTVQYIAENDQINAEAKKNILNAGGNLDFAAQTLLKQRGVALESDVPYLNAKTYLANGIDSSLERKDVAYLKNAMEMSIDNKELIKQCIVDNGIVGVSIYADGDYYNSTYNSFYCADETSTNHAVSLVGWDDNFPRDGFNNSAPGNGAWLVRNSWDDTGYKNYMSYYSYFWISYYDTSLTQPDVYMGYTFPKSAWTYTMMSKEDFPGNSYYYDSQIHNSGYRHTNKNQTYSANVFCAASGAAKEEIKAVTFNIGNLDTDNDGTKYEIYVYTGDSSLKTDPTSGTLHSSATTTGKISIDGYYTIDLNSPVIVESGDYFSIVVKRCDSYTINYESGSTGGGNGVQYSVGIQQGQSLYSYNGSSWTDMTSVSNGNFTITALTSDVTSSEDSSSIELSKSSLSLTSESPTATLTVTVKDKDGNKVTNPSVGWTSSDTSVATVNNGTVTAVGAGTAVITATSNGKSATCNITVTLSKAAKPTVSPAGGTVAIGDAITLSSTTAGAKIYYTLDGTDPTESSTLYEGAINVGSDVAGTSFTLKARAYADYYTASDIASYSFSVGSQAGLSVTPATIELTTSRTSETITATVKKDDGTTDTSATINWSVEDDGIAKINKTSGSSITVTAVASGSTTITVTSGTNTATCEVTVSLSQAATPVSDKTDSTLYVGAEISVSSTTEGAKIYYTSDGVTTPTKSSTEYTGSIKITSAMAGKSYTYKFIAYADYYDASEVLTYTFTVESKAGLTLSTESLKLTSADPTATLTATVIGDDGKVDTGAKVTWSTSDATVATVANGVVTAVGSGTANITATSGKLSAVCVVTVEISQLPVPSADKASGSRLTFGTEITLSCVNADATIYYSLDGSTPSTKYTAPIVIGSEYAGQTVVLKAKAAAAYYTDSNVASYTYTVEDKSGIKLSKDDVKLTSANPSVTLTATVLKPDGSTSSNAAVVWKTSDADVAVVDNGTVTAVGTGNATITASYGTLSKSCAVEVEISKAATPEISFSASGELSIGDVIYTRCATSVAKVYYTLDGSTPTKESELSDGTIEITKDMAGKSYTLTLKAFADHYIDSDPASCSFTVEDLSKVELSKDKISFTEVGAEETLTATVYDAAGDENKSAVIKWSSSDESVAVVNNGTVRAVASGNAVIKAESGTCSADCAVVVRIIENREPAVSTNILVNPDSISLNGAGKTVQLKVTVEDQYDLVIEDPQLSFESSDDKVATVNKSGLVTSVSAGNAVITVKSGDVSAECKVTVTLPKAAKPVAEPSEDTELKIGSSITVKCDTAGATIRYTTDGSDPDESSAVTKGSIAITKEMAGKTFTLKLRAYANGYEPGGVAAYTYKVEDKSAIEISESKISFTEIGDSKVLTATVYDAAGDVKKDATVEWSSSDTTVATVENGKVTAVASGNAVIKASCGELFAECDVKVVIMESRDPAVSTNIILTPDSISFSKKGATQQIKATVEDQYGLIIDNPDLRFESDNTSVATVSDTGLVKAVADGNAVITVWSGAVCAHCIVTVEISGEDPVDPIEDEETHTVVFKVNGAEYFTSDVIKGHTLDVIPQAPEGSFLCWIDEETDAVWNTSAPVYRDMVLNARFAEDESRSGYDSVPDLAQENLYLVKGQKVQLDSSVGWESRDKAIVTVSKKGVLTAKKAGAMTTVRSEDGNIVYTVYIIQPKFKEKAVAVAAGEEVQLVLELGANAAEYPVAWSSSAPAVASVTGGRVYGIAKGSAKITATVNGKAYTCTVKVSDTKKVKVDASTTDIVLAPMQSVNTKIKGEWSADEGMQNVGSDKKPVYANSVVSVTKSGKITAIGCGTTTLHAGGRNITVTVSEPVEQVKYVAAGKKISLKYTSVKNAKINDWKSSNTAVATVEKGKVVAKSVGYTTISCTYKAYDIDGAGFTYLTTVYVENPDLKATEGITRIKGDKYELHLKKGTDRPVRFTADSTCAVYQPVVFKSNKAAVAYADENGMIHAVSSGKAKLTTVINKKTITITVIVDQ